MSMKLGVLFCAVLFVGVAGWAADTTCDYPMWDDPGATHQFTVSGSEVEVTYGAHDQFSLVGTRFILARPGDSGPGIDLCEARSAAGAGWQHTEFTGKPNGDSFIRNQACGNAAGSQWGYSTTVTSKDTPDEGYIIGKEWLPSYYDSYQSGGVHEGRSPCLGNSEFFSYLRRTVTATAEADTKDGRTVRMSFTTRLKTAGEQSWAWTHKVDAFYFDRSVARTLDMVIYMQGEGGWQLGPIPVYENWSIEDLKDQNNVERGQMLPTPPWGGSWSEIHADVEQFTFVVQLEGQSIAFGMRDLPDGFTLRMAEEVYCSDAGDDNCGSLDLIVFHGGVLAPSFADEELREYTLTWDIGSAQQLADMGYYCPPGQTQTETTVPVATYLGTAALGLGIGAAAVLRLTFWRSDIT